MAAVRRSIASALRQLRRDMDGLAMERGTLGAPIREAGRIYVEERKKRDMRERMKRGYREMARINLALAEEGLVFEAGVLPPGGSRWNE